MGSEAQASRLTQGAGGMRRIRPSETLHGTSAGQVVIDQALAARYGLTERESVCAALLKMGCAPSDVADRLEISLSTAEKHLLGLRRKLGVTTTREAAVTLLREDDADTARIPDTYGVVLPIAGGHGAEAPAGLVRDLRRAGSLQAMLDRSRQDLRSEGVEALFYFFLPLSAASYRKGHILQLHSGSQQLADAFRADGGRTHTNIAARLFREPDRTIVFDLDDERERDVSASVRDACRSASLRRGIAIGSPFAAGYVALTACCRNGQAAANAGGEGRRGALLRHRLLLLQNLAYSFGALARTAGLSTRERDALTQIAAGQSRPSAARELGTSERMVSQLLKSARAKLGAETTTEAVATAMALNALVFL